MKLIKHKMSNIVLIITLVGSGLFGLLITNDDDSTIIAFNQHQIGDVSTNVLSLPFDEDYEQVSSNMVYEAEYSYSGDGVDDLINGVTNKVYDLTNEQNDGYLDAGPAEQFSDSNFVHNKHDIPRRTHTALQGRAIDFWKPPSDYYPSTSDCRYIRIPGDDSFEIDTPSSNGVYNYYDFELRCWPYDVEHYNKRVLINYLWDDYTFPNSLQVEGWYRITINSDNKLQFEYPISSGTSFPFLYYKYAITSTATVEYNEWSKINIRLILGDNQLRIYFYINGKEIDNILEDTYMPFFISPSTEKYFTIGADPYSYYSLSPNAECGQFFGLIDEVRIDKGTSNNEWANDVNSIGRQLIFIDFDEQGGSYSLDQTMHNNDATLHYPDGGDPWGSNGVYGGYLSCIDYRYYATIDDPETNNNGPQELSVEAWIKPNSDWNPLTDNINIISKAYTSSYYSFFLNIGMDRKITFGVGGINPNQNCGVISISSVPVDKWSYVSGTFKDGEVNVFINGKLENTAIFTWDGRNIPYDNNNEFYIGRNQHDVNLAFPGKIDQVGICDYVKVINPEIVRFEFEDGDGSLSIPTTDWTGFDNDGSLINGATIVDSGRYNKGVSFSSSQINPHVRVSLSPDPSHVDFIVGEFTVDCWIKPDSTQSGQCVFVSQFNSWELGMNSDKLPYFKIKETGGNWIQAIHTLPVVGDYNDAGSHNTWHHVMGVFKFDEILIFLDGKSGYGDKNTNDATHSFNTYTRQISTGAIYIGVRYTGSQYQNQYYGIMDSFRLRKGIFNLMEDTDGDSMSDKYEIIRSLHSDQFDPFEHNSRFAILVAGVTNGASLYPFDERHFKLEAYDMREVLIKQGYDDDDIIYLDNDDTYQDSSGSTNWNQPEHYENDFWIDGDCIVDNIRNTFSKLTQGGQFTLYSAKGSGTSFLTNTRIVPKLDNYDYFYWESNSHGGFTTIDSKSKFFFCLSDQVASGHPSHTLNNNYDAILFKNDLDSLNNKYSTVIVGACHSGDLVSPYYNILNDNRIIVTSSSSGQTSSIPGLSWSSRIRGNSSSYYEKIVGYCDPSNSIYSGGTSNMIKHIKWGLNADDLLEKGWVIDGNGVVPHIVFIPYKKTNTRNIIVSIQEAYNYAKMWIEFDNDQTTSNYAPPFISKGSNIPSQVVV